MNPLQLIHPKYLFDPTPGTDFAYLWPLLIVGAVVFLGSFLFKAKHALTNNWPARMREWGFFFILVTFFRDQNIPYLGSRIAIVFVILVGLIYAGWAWKRDKDYDNLNSAYNALRAQRKSQKADPYLPKKKRK